MNIEELNRTQIVLLTLLVSFVTSIATGIVTVTLLDQAPPAVTQTINRVVERTVERVVPQVTQGAAVKEVTVVVKEEDLITDSINKNGKTIVRITRPATGEAAATSKVLGLGIIVDAAGTIATDASIISNTGSYSVILSDGSVFPAEPVAGVSGDFALLSIKKDEAHKDWTFPSATLGSASALKLGQTVISITGAERDRVSIGIVGSLLDGEEKTAPNATTTVTVLASIATNIASDGILAGTPLFNVFGETIGIARYEDLYGTSAEFVPVRNLKTLLTSLAAPATESKKR